MLSPGGGEAGATGQPKDEASPGTVRHLGRTAWPSGGLLTVGWVGQLVRVCSVLCHCDNCRAAPFTKISAFTDCPQSSVRVNRVKNNVCRGKKHLANEIISVAASKRNITGCFLLICHGDTTNLTKPPEFGGVSPSSAWPDPAPIRWGGRGLQVGVSPGAGGAGPGQGAVPRARGPWQPRPRPRARGPAEPPSAAQPRHSVAPGLCLQGRNRLGKLGFSHRVSICV